MTIYEIVIGLEIHVKLASKYKLFCTCENVQDFDALEPNTHICPVCTGQPGALPVLQQEPLELALKLGKLLQCEIKQYSSFDRKSYFYPDLPMGYQITQFHDPTMINGRYSFYADKEFTDLKSVRIRDAHMEIDTAKTTRIWEDILIDRNRSGTPLIEIVTEPDFRSADEVVGFLKALQTSLQRNGISQAQMEAGQMRADVNISIRPVGSDTLGNRVEMKNMNSFGAVQRAIALEYERQVMVLQSWWTIDQETRGRDDASSTSYVMRSKEDAMDYRYMPEPDLPVLVLSDALLQRVGDVTLIHVEQEITKLRDTYQFSKEYINTLINDQSMLQTLHRVTADGHDPKVAMQRLAGPVAKRMNEQLCTYDDIGLSYEHLLAFLQLIQENKLPPTAYKQLFAVLLDSGKHPATLVSALGLEGMSDDELLVIVQDICAKYPAELADPRKHGFLIGQIVKASSGKADARKVWAMIQKMVL
jgi:aspartyl-tRNA(Asn)/glutamyl-tRNA(Gln) amidotransferase subunit B